MRISRKPTLKQNLWVIILGTFIFSLNSCGLVSNVREQGDSKSWMVVRKANNESISNVALSSIDSQNSFHDNLKNKHSSLGKVMELETKERFNLNNQNKKLESFGFQIHTKGIETNECSSELPLKVKLSNKNDLNQSSFRSSKIELSQKSIMTKSVKYTKSNRSRKNRSAYFGWFALLALVISMFVAESSAFFFIFFIGAIALTILSLVHLFLKPEPKSGTIFLSVLLTILNVIVGLLALLAWAWA